MDEPGYEPMLDAKWAMPFAALLILLIAVIMGMLKIGMWMSKRHSAKRATSAVKSRPAPTPPIIQSAIQAPLPDQI